MRKIVVIAHDIRSIHNIGSLMRTCEGLGIEKLYLTGYTPYPHVENDQRLPHIYKKLTSAISKTALGAEELLQWEHHENIESLLTDLKINKYQVCALEQSDTSMPLPDFKPSSRIAIVIGREVEGIDASILALCDNYIEIPMFGKKESFNVVQAAAMMLYHTRFF